MTVDFPIYSARTRSLRGTFLRLGTGGRVHRARNHLSVRALDEVNLAFRHGDRVALLGHNGAGKTTLLRVLAGVYEPPVGRVWREGRTAALVNMSLGLDADVTGYENILTRAMLLGHGPDEARARSAEIARFTELGDYLAMPVETYSTGMRFRLAFAVSTSFQPEILLIDEWLSVGDRAFAEKAERRVAELAARAGILVLASRDKPLLERLCNKAVVLDAGRVAATGSIDEMLARY